MDFKELNMEDIKNKDIRLFVTEERKVEIMNKMGYTEENGFLVDMATKKQVLAEDDKPIKISKDKQYALISGSHRFVRNVAGYSQLLTEKGRIDLRPE